MLRSFYKYLLLYKKASIAGVGIFSVKRQPARYDFANKQFVAPIFQTAFYPDASVTEEEVFYSFISKEQAIEEAAAIDNWRNFVEDVRKSINANKAFVLPGLGHLSNNDLGELQFEATPHLTHYFPDVPAEKVPHQDIEFKAVPKERSLMRTNDKVLRLKKPVKESPGTKEYWWLYAIGLAVVGIAAIVFYYMQNGSLE